MKIAVISYKDVNGYEYNEYVAQHITNWMEVSDDEFKALQLWSTKHPYTFIVRHHDPFPDMEKIMAEAKEIWAQQEAKRLADAKKREEKRLLREKQKIAEKKNLLEKLKKELENG